MRLRSVFSAALAAALIWGGAPAASAIMVPEAAPATVPGTSAETPEASSPETRAPEPSLVVAPGEAVLREVKDGLELRALLRNPTDAPLAAGEIVYELSTAPVRTSAELDSALTTHRESVGVGGTSESGKEGETAESADTADTADTADPADSTPVSEANHTADAGLAFAKLTSAEVGEVDAAEQKKGENQADGLGAPGEQRVTTDIAADDLPFTDITPPGTYVLRAQFTPEGANAPLATTATPLVWRSTATQKPTAEPKPGTQQPGTQQPGNEQQADEKQPDAAQKAEALTKLDVSFIVPFVLPSSIHTMPTRGQLSDLAPGWDRLLTAAEAARATLAIDPRVIAGIRSYGTEAPAEAREFLSRIESSASPSFLLQFADADPAAQAALGFTSLLSPTNLEFVTRFGEFEAAPESKNGTADPDPDATDAADAASEAKSKIADENTDKNTDKNAAENSDTQPDAGEEAGGDKSNDNDNDNDNDNEGNNDAGSDESVGTPTVEQLTAWPEKATAWPAEGNVDEGALDLLAASNVDQLVLDSGNVKHTGGPRITLGDASVVVTDNALGAVAAAALTGDTDIDRAAARAELVAMLAVRAQAEEGGVVLGLGRAAVADAEDPELLVEALTLLDAVRATPIEDQAEGSGELRAAGPLEPRLALLRSAADREAAVNEVGAVLDDPQYLSGYQRTRLLQLFATRYAPQDGGFDRAATAFRTRDAELLEGVQVISAEHTQLVGVSTSVPIQLHNSLPFNATVQVNVQPVSAALEVEQRVFKDVAVGAEANERVLVPVRSRVSSGESGLVVTVAARGGDPTVFTGTLPLSISSIVETIMLWVLGIAAAWLFVGGAIRSVRKRRTGSARKQRKPRAVGESDVKPHGIDDA
ncbi:DUF6049 family protein [Leucobacter sp. HY1910]